MTLSKTGKPLKWNEDELFMPARSSCITSVDGWTRGRKNLDRLHSSIYVLQTHTTIHILKWYRLWVIYGALKTNLQLSSEEESPNPFLFFWPRLMGQQVLQVLETLASLKSSTWKWWWWQLSPLPWLFNGQYIALVIVGCCWGQGWSLKTNGSAHQPMGRVLQ